MNTENNPENTLPTETAADRSSDTPTHPTLTTTQTILSELNAEFLLLLPAESALTPLNQPSSPDKQPINWRQNPDTLAEAIDNYLSKPVKESAAHAYPAFREPADDARPTNLDTLSLADQIQIRQWLSESTYKHVLDRLAYPPPIGLSIDTSQASLQRLLDRLNYLDILKQNSEMARLINEAKMSAAAFSAATLQIVRSRILKSLMQQFNSDDAMRNLFHILHRIQAGELAERRVSLAERKQSEPKHNPSPK